jgi:PEP-CTERM motif
MPCWQCKAGWFNIRCGAQLLECNGKVPAWDGADFAVAACAEAAQALAMLGRFLSATILSALTAAPAAAQSASSAVPEPSGMALLGLGLAGVALGRHLSRRPPQD